jgi:dipeptidyl aminopeptidase/acylaminoacyl peptidase
MDGDFFATAWSPNADNLLLMQIVSAQMRFYVYDLEKSTLHRLDHPSGTIFAAYYYNDDEIWANLSDSTHPSRLVAFDAKTGHQLREVLSAGVVPASQPFRSVEFAGAHGEPVHAWVGTPSGDGPWPMILHTHGGPTAAMFDSYSPMLQTWLDHGFAIMSVNYHGSTTFGRAFEQAIWGKLGELEVQDMAAAYHYAVDNGIAIADSILLTGGSYGGYLTLQALGVRPDLWAGGMADVAIGDWALMYEDQAETLRGYQVSLFGGTPAETPEQTAKSSPITYAEAVRAPVLVIQGANDTRCPARQMHVYEDKLKSLNKDITVEWFDAGHGSRAMDEQIGHMEKRLRWAYRVLG